MPKQAEALTCGANIRIINNANAAARRTAQTSLTLLSGASEQYWSRAMERLLPEQFFVPARESATIWSGERQLLLAVLEEAIHTFLTCRGLRTGRERRLFREAQDWFWSEDCDWLYAFESICLHLQLDPQYIRRGLLRWQHLIVERADCAIAENGWTADVA